MKKTLVILSILLSLNVVSPTISSNIGDSVITEEQKELLNKFIKINNLLPENLKTKNLTAYWEKLPLYFPIDINKLKYISSDYGLRKHPIYKTWGFHHGIDIVAPKGTAIISTCDGTVIATKKSKFGYGNRVTISHSNLYKTHYAHLNNIDVKIGQKIKHGDKIGTLGSTGISTGSHLHYEIRYNDVPIDPMFFTYDKKENRNFTTYLAKLIALEKI